MTIEKEKSTKFSGKYGVNTRMCFSPLSQVPVQKYYTYTYTASSPEILNDRAKRELKLHLESHKFYKTIPCNPTAPISEIHLDQDGFPIWKPLQE